MQCHRQETAHNVLLLGMLVSNAELFKATAFIYFFFTVQDELQKRGTTLVSDCMKDIN